MLIKVHSAFSKVQSPTITFAEGLSFEDFVYLSNNEWNIVTYWELS